MEKDQIAKEFAEKLSKFVNNYGCPMKELAQEVLNDHRTLQQTTMRLFMTVIEEWSKQEQYDLRNEQTIKLSKKIMEAVGDAK